jgi:hypothetical protein
LIRKLFLMDFKLLMWFFSLIFAVLIGETHWRIIWIQRLYDASNCCFGPYVNQVTRSALLVQQNLTGWCIECVGYFYVRSIACRLSAMFVTPNAVTCPNMLLAIAIPLLLTKKAGKKRIE